MIETFRTPNGERLLAWRGTRQRDFDGTNLKPRKTLENAPRTHPMVPALFAGDQLHYNPSDRVGRCVGRLYCAVTIF
jgi:hypothetical protein